MSWSQPQLKRGVDLQLQTAFGDGQWTSVIRLAEKRLRTFNDQYYEIVKICAASQLDSPSDKASALIALDKFVQEGTVLKDVDGIDLLEWAVGDLQDEQDFSRNLGPLRARLVKACPKDRNSAIRCLESCLLHWDLVSAQQIAAILDRSFPQERTYFFWNVVVTYLLSLSDQCPADKRKLYGTLALKQMQRAAQASAQSTGGDADRSVRSEEEILLYYRVLETNGADEEWQAALSDPKLGPVPQFHLGHKELLLEALEVSARRLNWRDVYSLCKRCLMGPEDAQQANLLACDWAIWKHFLTAASHLRATKNNVVDDVAATLSAFSSNNSLRPIYLRNILLARVAAAFQLGGTANCLEELQHYIEIQCSSAACFDDIRGFVEQLDTDGLKALAYEFVPQLAKRQLEPLHVAAVKALAYQLQYLTLTVPGQILPQASSAANEPPQWECVISAAVSTSPACPERFQTVAESSAALYRALTDSLEIVEGREPDCVPELAILTATALIRLSGVGEDVDTCLGPMSSSRLNRILQATLILEHQLTRTPRHTRVTLLLVRIYILLGCISRAKELWATMDVKRTIIDSLSPYFLDRLSTLAPAAVAPIPQRPEKALSYPLKAYYSHSLRLRMPRRLADAFEAESLTSILEIPRFIERLRVSCTLVMGHLEERRALRALGYRTATLDQETLLSEILPETQLSAPIDYGSVPQLDATSARPIHSLLQLGPGPSNARSHLGIFAEEFFELLLHKSPTGLKPTSADQAMAVEHTVVAETLQQLSDSVRKMLRSASGKLTQQEQGYFELVGVLANLITITTTTPSTPGTATTATQLCDAAEANLEGLCASSLSMPAAPIPSAPKHIFGSTHGLFYVRDSTAAIRLACAYLLAFTAAQKPREKNGQNSFPKEVSSSIKSLDAAAAKAMSEGKAHVASLKQEVESGPLDFRLRDWAFVDGDDSILTKEVRLIGRDSWQSWASMVADSYRSNVKGWESVKWE